MSDDLDPFAPDSSVPDMSTTNGGDYFSFGNDFAFSQPPPRNGSPWKLVAGIASVVVLLIVCLGVGIASAWLMLDNLTDSPDRVVRTFYEALEVQDYARLGECIDPEESFVGDTLPMVGMFKKEIEKLLVEQLGVELELAWHFMDLEFSAAEQTESSAQVKVTGRVRVYDKKTNMGLTIPYHWIHDVVKKNGRWYIQL